MDPQTLAEYCTAYLGERLPSDPAHDLAHIKRVVKITSYLSDIENVSKEITLPAAWLHDCVPVAKSDPERASASRQSADAAVAFLAEIGYPAEHLDDIHHAIEAHSWSAGVPTASPAARVVQDADRLDALGAIGVARWMMVGGALHHALYDPEDPFCERREPDDSRWTLDHYVKKLRHLPERMGTEAGRAEAQRRLKIMDHWLEDLAREITGPEPD